MLYEVITRDERALHPLREAQLLLDALLVLAHLGIEPRVLDGDRGLAGQQREQSYNFV